MSQDLLAAFGFAEDVTQHSSPNPVGNSTSLIDDFQINSFGSSGIQQSETLIEEDDDWGEFEGVEAATSSVQHQKPDLAPVRYKYDLDELGPAKPSMLEGRSKKSEVEPEPRTFLAPKFRDNKIRHPSPVKDPNVLFDASEPSDDDKEGDDDDYDNVIDDDFGDFGDFESSEIKVPTKMSTKPPAQFDLLGLEDDIGSFPTLGNNVQKVESVSKPLNFVESDQIDEPWDEVPEWDQKSASEQEPSNQSQQPHLLDFPGVQDPKLSEDTVPPTNVPPPSIILSIFPTIFETVSNNLLKPLSNQTADAKQKILSDPGTAEYLRGYLFILIVLARVIAGRKHRWKRDHILAQSVRIGPASSGKLSGMKVASVDKAEVGREDREVSEVLRQWNLQAGKVKSIISEVKKMSQHLDSIPELKETMPIRSAKELEGGISSVKPCALCGLKREERIGKVDMSVMDSFGEWWVERTNMHRACRNFWIYYETALRSR